MRVSQFEEAVLHWRGSVGGLAAARHYGREIVVPIEAVRELGQVARAVLVADRPIGTDDRRLDVAERGVDPLEGGRQHCLAAGSGVDRLMGTAGRDNAAD